MKCPKCQFENREGAKFCNECGHRFGLICPECGTDNRAGSQFCDECGHRLGSPKEIPPIDFQQPQSYTPKFLADKILTNRSAMEGEHKLVTVLFADVANYTSMCERLDPEEVHQIMDGCFQILMNEIHRYEGTINQFTGDGIMALFGAPVAHEDHAQRACYAALAIQRAMEAYGENIEKNTGAEFKIRIGLNSGPVIVGSIGDDLRMDYTAVGDTTNLASRMEGIADPGCIVASAQTQRLARDFFEFASIGKVEVKGKKEPQEAFGLIKTSAVETRIGASAAKGLTRFVGRKNSMAALFNAFDKVKSGTGQVVGVVGEAGVGKSRLLLEMRSVLPQAEFVYLEGRCLHYGGSMPYLPVLDILRSYFEIKEGDREFLIKKKMKQKISDLEKTLHGLLPPFQELLSVKVDDGVFDNLDPKTKRERTFEAIRDLFFRLSQGRPLILAIEDLHWIDKTTEEFLDYLIGWLANSPILLILLYRPEYTHQWGSKSYYNQVGLDQLGMESSAELIKAILEEGEVAPELRQLILNRAAGNPLFMEEFTHTLLENGSIERRNKQFVLNRRPSDIQVPDTIQGIIAARIDRLEEDLKRIMQVASVIGREFAFRILQSIMGMREELKSQLLNLQGLEFIYERSLFPELEYIFKHALTQEVAYNSLLQKRRKEIHEKIGEAIEQIYTERLEEFYEMLAYHYFKGENSEKAYHYLKLSGNKASRNYASHEAFRLYSEAIEVLAKMPETKENKRKKIEACRLQAPVMVSLGFPEGSLQHLKDGERISEEVGDERGLAFFYSFLGNYFTVKGDPLLGIQYSEKCFQEAEKIEDVELMASAGCALALSYFFSGECLKVVDMAPKVIRLLEKTKRESEFFGRPVSAYVHLNLFHSAALIFLGRFPEAETFCEKALRCARSMDHLSSIGQAEMYYGFLFARKGDGRNALEYLESSLKHLEEGGFLLLLPFVLAFSGFAYHCLGKLDKARNHLQNALEMQKDLGNPFMMSLSYNGLSMVLLDLDGFEDAQKCAEKALNLAQQNKELSSEGMSWIILGRIIGKKEPTDPGKAEEHILKGIKMLDDLKLKPDVYIGYLYLGELYADMGQREKAMENLKKAEKMFQEMEMDYWLAKTKDALEKV